MTRSNKYIQISLKLSQRYELITLNWLLTGVATICTSQEWSSRSTEVLRTCCSSWSGGERLSSCLAVRLCCDSGWGSRICSLYTLIGCKFHWEGICFGWCTTAHHWTLFLCQVLPSLQKHRLFLSRSLLTRSSIRAVFNDLALNEALQPPEAACGRAVFCAHPSQGRMNQILPALHWGRIS